MSMKKTYNEADATPQANEAEPHSNRLLTVRMVRLVTILSLFVTCLGHSTAELPVDTLWPLQIFKSTPIQAPFMNVTKMGQTEPGFLFLSPQDTLRGTNHPTIYSDDGQLVWQGPSGNVSALQPQMLDGEPVIAYWSGFDGHGFGFGSISILNASYHEIHRVTLDCQAENFATVFDPMSFDSCIDIHESQITDDGTILVTAVNVTRADLTSIGGPKDGWIQDGLVYEIDIKTNEVIFRWSAHEHVSQVHLGDVRAPLAGSAYNKTDPYGYPHLNAVSKYGSSYLVSSRYLCSVFLIASNGSVIWHLHGQTGGDFQLGLDTNFCYQHDVRITSQTPDRITLSMHNNQNTPVTGHTSLTTGLVLDVQLRGSKQVTLKSRMWDATEPVFAESQGNNQMLGNGHSLQDHGATPKIEEYDEHGAVVMRARFGYNDTMQTYRVYRYPWVGRPSSRPDAAVACSSKQEGRNAVYVSWNGATDVEGWRVYSGSDVTQTVVANGFETTILLDGLSDGDLVVVQAVGGVGDGTRSDSIAIRQGC